MDIKSEGVKLLSTHIKLYSGLIKIPDKRQIEFREEFTDGKWFGKPRFRRPKYKWEKEQFKNIRNHLQDIWNFFEKYNYWFDETVLPLIESNSRRVSQKSIIFLLENDIWNTTEVYGKYLIERVQDTIFISYYRFNTKINKNEIETFDKQYIKEWICKDAIKQIKEHFTFLWSKLETEIRVCMEENYSKKPKITLTTEYLKTQFDLTIRISKDWPEASLLSLGRICELWLLFSLGKKHKGYYEDLIKKAEMRSIINENQGKLLYKIKHHYNYLKHKTYYQVEKDLLDELINQFSDMIRISE